MISKQTVLICDGGLHARPASDFVACAKTFQSAVTIRNLDKPERPATNAKSIMRVLAEGISSGTNIEIGADGPDEEAAIAKLMELIDKKLDKGTRRVTIHLPYDKTGMLDSLYREAKVESVEYGTTVDVVAVCNPRLLGQLRDYVEGWQEEKEDWEL